MAWIMKNSAGAEVDRRDEPYLDDDMKQTLERETMWKYPTRQAATLPVLHAIQEKQGWIPYQGIEEAAAFLGISETDVLDTATFYEEFWLQPKGRYLIMVCQSIACEIMGHDKLLEMIQAKLGIEPGQTTDDNRFTLMTAECLGSCGTAPVALVNEKLHENLTMANFEEVLDTLD